MLQKKVMKWNYLRKMAGVVCMVFVMAMAGMTAFAASPGSSDGDLATHKTENDVIDASRTGTITIHKYDITAAEADGADVSNVVSTGQQNADAEKALKDYAVEGVEFTCLRVGEIETLSKNGTVKLIYGVPGELQKIIGLDENDAEHTDNGNAYFTGKQINDAMAEALEDNTTTKDKLESYVKSGSRLELTDADGRTSRSGLEVGLYLIVETKVPEDVICTTNPWFVQLPMTDYEGDYWFYDVICYPKNQTGVPTLDKKVRNSPDTENVVTAADMTLDEFTREREEYTYQDTVTASEGETLHYELISKLPHITSAATYLRTYTFTDVLSKGITYGRDAVIAFYDSDSTISSANVKNVRNSKAVAVWDIDSDKFTQTYTAKDDGSHQMTIEMTEKGLEEINRNYTDKYLAVYYTATVNSNDTVVTGDKGNLNEVSLEWRRTSQNYYDILRDKCTVYTYGIELTKTFSDNKGDAAKVQFTLQNKDDNYYVQAAGINGLYYVTGKVKAKADATRFSPSGNGKLTINGMEGDEYVLTEVHSDTGYSLLKEPIAISVTSAKADMSASAKVDGTLARMNVCPDDRESANAMVVMEVKNFKGFLLPQTGGRGIYAFPVMGLLIAAFGCFCMSKRKKKED